MTAPSRRLVLALVTSADSAHRVLELIGAARSAATALDASCAVLVTACAPDIETRIASCEVDQLLRLAPAVDAADAEGLVAAAVQICLSLRPALVLLCADAIGTTLGPRLATRLNGAYVSTCLGFQQDGQGAGLRYLRAYCGGRALEVLDSPSVITVVSIKAKQFAPIVSGLASGAAWSTVAHEVACSDVGIRVIGRESSNQVAAANLDEAEVIISGGRGVGGIEGFALLEALAKRLGGCVGASRAAVDVGWVSKNLQVGQTGTTVAPELYLAVGISGAIQHQSGMVGAKHIIAINTDDEAAIFGIAHLGVVHDYREILPLLLAAFSD